MPRTSSKREPLASATVERILTRAIQEGVSDIHLIPRSGGAVVRFRVDGELSWVDSIPVSHYENVVNRIKVLSNLSTIDHNVVQEGQMTFEGLEDRRHMRVSVLPTNLGERVTIRVFRNDSSFSDLTCLGMSQDFADYYRHLAFCNQGLVLIAGPTGCGKTTTLYSTALALNAETLNILSLEDPCECVIPGISQVNLQSVRDLSYAQALKAALRQDPDVILVGEIRDGSAAQAAVDAALSGHLVIATIHAFDSVTSLARMASLGVEPKILAASLNCVVSQRLVRRLCPACKQKGEPSEPEKQFIKALNVTVPKDTWQALGCDLCGDTGFVGRVGIFELMPASGDVRMAVHGLPDVSSVMAAALSSGMEPLMMSAIRAATQGETTLCEVARLFQMRSGGMGL